MTDDRTSATAKRLGITPQQVQVMIHALGFQKRRGRAWNKGGWRNYFDAGEGDDAPTCGELDRGGWMWRTSGGVYVVTMAGIAALKLTGWKFVKAGER